MKKLTTLLLLAALSMLAQPIEAKENTKKCCVQKCSVQDKCKHKDPEFGYFYLVSDQTVDGNEFDPVSWELAGSVNTDDIFIDSSDPTKIILKKRGYYLVNYIVTADVITEAANPDPGFQFALYLNDSSLPIAGSTYGTGLTSNGPQVNGQVVFRVDEIKSTLQLVNQCENSVELDNDVGTDNTNEFGFNVSGSLVIQRLSNLKFE